MTTYISKNSAVIDLIKSCFICLDKAFDYTGEPLTDLFLQTLLQAIYDSRVLSIYSGTNFRIYLYGGRKYTLLFQGELITPPEITVFQANALIPPAEVHTLIQAIYQGSALLITTRPLTNDLVEREYHFKDAIYKVTCQIDWTPALGLEHKAGLFL